jgi:LysR family hydrogen peroxide-inducible transcriptional activator
MMEQADAIEQLAQAHQDPLAGSLRVGAIPTLSPYLMPLILVPLKKHYPQVRLVLSEEVTDTLLTRLHNHEIDAVLLATPVEEPDLEIIPLFDEPFWLAHPRKHPLYNKDDITRKDLDHVELLLLSEGHCLAKQAMEVCRMKERSEQGEMADLRASSLETLLQLVGAGFGCTLVPALAVRGSWTTDTGIIARPLAIKDAYRTVSLVYRNTFPRRAAIEAFAHIIRGNLPNTVHLLDHKKRRKKKTIRSK